MITTFEHATLTKKDFTHVGDFDWLIEQNFDGIAIQRKNRQWQLKFSHYIGVIGLPSGEQLEILPKIGKNGDILQARQWTQRMLIDIWHKLMPKQMPNIALQKIIHINKHLSLIEWLKTIFWQQFWQYQPNQHYQHHEQNQTFLQGKLLIKQQILYNHHKPHKFFQQTEQFLSDTACNRLVKTVMIQLFGQNVLLSLPVVWTSIQPFFSKNYLEILQQAKQELQLLPTLIAKKNGDFINFCYTILILQQGSQQGNFATPTLWINMQFAFEKWVSYQIKQQFSHVDDSVIEQKSQALLADTLLQMKPDIWVKSGNDIIVMDVKWKEINNISQIKLADMYQLLTYANQFNATQAWLIVPTDDKNQAKQKIQLLKPMGFELFFVPFLLM